MFSWEDQELANIIWGEADDHIVPYPEESERKSQSQFGYHDNNAHEEPANSNLSEQKPAATKTKLHGGKPESNDDLSFVASNPELNPIDFLTGKETDLVKGSKITKNRNEDRELGDIISNSWANIGSFDDLDRMFSNDVLVDHASLDRTDELWTSSRDAVKSSSLALDSASWGLVPIGNLSGQFGFNTEYLHNGSQSYANRFEKAADLTCYTQERLHSSYDEGEIGGSTDPNLILEKSKWSTSQPKNQLKSDKINNDREPRDRYPSWLPPEISVQKFDSQTVPDTSKSYLSSVLDQENMPHQSTCLLYHPFSNPYLPAYSCGNVADQCTFMSVLPGTDDKHQPVLSNADACLNERVLMEKSIDTPMKSQNMTPQEKIEKLRRRQKMRALLAIKKQQQQLNHPVPITDYSIAQQNSEEDQVLYLAGVDFETEENIDTIYDPNSPLKQDGSSAVSMEVADHNVEDTALYQLQDAVTKLDTKIRLCIRDSLFRLAQSAMQRNYASDLSCGNRHGDCEPNILKANISNQESSMKRPSAETETNCIDRAVAQLLFNQPHKSTSKHIRTPVSSIPPKIPPGLETGASRGVPLSLHVTKNSKSEHKISTQEDLREQPQTDTIMNQKMKQKMVESAD